MYTGISASGCRKHNRFRFTFSIQVLQHRNWMWKWIRLPCKSKKHHHTQFLTTTHRQVRTRLFQLFSDKNYGRERQLVLNDSLFCLRSGELMWSSARPVTLCRTVGRCALIPCMSLRNLPQCWHLVPSWLAVVSFVVRNSAILSGCKFCRNSAWCCASSSPYPFHLALCGTFQSLYLGLRHPEFNPLHTRSRLPTYIGLRYTSVRECWRTLIHSPGDCLWVYTFTASVAVGFATLGTSYPVSI